MADIITGLGVNLFDRTYTGGDLSKIAAITSGRLSVDGSGVTQPISGSVSISEPSNGNVAVYGTVASVVQNSSVVVAYYSIAAGDTLYLKNIIASASGGPCKVIVEYAAAATGAASGTYCIGFFSSANPTLNLDFIHPIAISGATFLRVTMRNDNPNTQDLYASIIGHSVSWLSNIF